MTMRDLLYGMIIRSGNDAANAVAVLCSGSADAFAEEMNITFPLGRDPSRTARFMKINSYPAFMIVKSGGEVAYIEVNGEASIDHLAALFDAYLRGEEAEAASKTQTAADSACTDDRCPLPGEPVQD